MEKIDAIIIPGGGLTADGELPPHVKSRFDRALELDQGDNVFICLSAGSPHVPLQLDDQGRAIWESRRGGEYLNEKGIPFERILLCSSCWDTIGNAWFSRVLHVEPAGFESLLIITSDFHMQRTKAIFEKTFQLKRKQGQVPRKYQLSFESTPNTSISPEIVAERTAYEQKQTERWLDTCKNFEHLEDLYLWLVNNHELYSSGKKINKISGEILKSYC